MAEAAWALDVTVGDAVVSVGTSGTAFTRATSKRTSRREPLPALLTPWKRVPPLVCTLNGARNLVATAEVLGVTLAELVARAECRAR